MKRWHPMAMARRTTLKELSPTCWDIMSTKNMLAAYLGRVSDDCGAGHERKEAGNSSVQKVRHLHDVGVHVFAVKTVLVHQQSQP